MRWLGAELARDDFDLVVCAVFEQLRSAARDADDLCDASFAGVGKRASHGVELRCRVHKIAAVGARCEKFSDCAKPSGCAFVERVDRGETVRGGAIVVTEPPTRFGDRRVENAALFARWAERDCAIGERDRAAEIISFECFDRGRAKVRDGAPGNAAANEVLCESAWTRGAGRFENFAGELVTERAIVVGERRVRCVANERVTKAILACAGRDDFGARERQQSKVDDLARHAGQERDDLFDGEAVSENARGAKDAARVGGELVETRLEDPEDRIGERFVAACGAANELFQKKCVALCACDERRNVGFRRAIAERVFHELGGRAFRKWRERDRNDATLGPQARKKLRHLRTRERENEERARRKISHHRIEHAHGRDVAPVQIFDHEHDGSRERRDPFFERRAQRVAHQTRVAARGAQHFARLVGKSHAAHFSEERSLGRAIERAALADAAFDLPALRVFVAVARDAGFASNRVGDRSERRAGAHGIAAPDQNERRFFARFET